MDPYSWNPQVLDNRVFMVIPLVYDPDSQLDLQAGKSLAAFTRSLKKLNPDDRLGSVGTPLAERFYRPSDKETTQKDVIWSDFKGNATQDFHPFVRQITGDFGTKAELTESDIDFRLCHPLHVQQESYVSQFNGGKSRQFTVSLGRAAQKRCGRSSVMLELRAPALYAFASGTAILVLQWEYVRSPAEATLTAAEVLEGNYALCHEYGSGAGSGRSGEQKGNADHKLGADPRHAAALPGAEFHAAPAESGEPGKRIEQPALIDIVKLLEIAAFLLPNELQAAIPRGRKILYTSLNVRTEDVAAHSDAALVLSHRLASRQTSDYLPSMEVVREAKLRPFVDVIHAASVEGGCCLAMQGEGSASHIQMFTKASFKNHYLPLFLATIHGHFWLLNQIERLPGSRKLHSYQEKEELDVLKKRLVNFRRFYLFPIASQISQQNHFYELWKNALMIPASLEVASQTVRDVGEQVQERRVRLITHWTGAVGGFVIGREVMAALRDTLLTNAYEWQKMLLLDDRTSGSVESIRHIADVSVRWDWAILLVAIAAGLVGYVLTRRFGLKGSEH